MYFLINIDYKTSNRCGARGLFQVISILGGDGSDVTNTLVDVGTHYPDTETLRRAIANRLGIAPATVDLEEV